MKFRFRNSALAITAATSAALLAACHQQPQYDQQMYAQQSPSAAVCTNRSGTRIPQNYCSNWHGIGANPYMWYYYPGGSYIPRVGQRVGGGSYNGASGVSYSRGIGNSGRSVVTGGTYGSRASYGGFGSSSGSSSSSSISSGRSYGGFGSFGRSGGFGGGFGG